MRSKTALLVLAEFFSTFAKLILFIFLTQVGGFELAGAYTYALSLITPIFILFGLSLRQIYVTSPSKVVYGEFLVIRIVAGAVGVLAVLLLAGLLRPDLLPLFLAMAFYRFMELFINLRIAFFQRGSQIGMMALATFLRAMLSTGAIAMTFLISQDLVLGVWSGTVLGMALYFLLPRLTGVEVNGKPSVPEFKDAVRTLKNGMQLSVSAFSVSLGVSVPVLVLGNEYGTSAVGVYSSIYYLSSVSNILFSAVSQAELRTFADLAAQKSYVRFQRRALKTSTGLAVVVLMGGVLIYFFGTDVFSYIFGPDFSPYHNALMIMIFTIVLAPFSFFLDVQMTALQRFPVQTLISLLSLGFTVVSSLVLIPAFSINGATITLFLTMLVRTVAKQAVVAQHLRTGM